MAGDCMCPAIYSFWRGRIWKVPFCHLFIFIFFENNNILGEKMIRNPRNLLVFFFFLSFSFVFGTKHLCTTKSCHCAKLNLTEETHLFYQVGETRSASTFQHTALCVAVMMKYGHDDVACNYLKYKKKKYNVVKTHSVKELNFIKGHYVLFTSTRSGAPVATHGKEFDIHFSQNFQDLLQLGGEYALRYYRDLFDLTDEEYEMLHEYIHYWQIMRKCCAGPQSSALFVRELWNEDPKKHKGRTPFLYNDCKYYDLEAIGKKMHETKFCQSLDGKHGEMCPGPKSCQKSFKAIENKHQEKLERIRNQEEQKAQQEREKEGKKNKKKHEEEEEDEEEETLRFSYNE